MEVPRQYFLTLDTQNSETGLKKGPLIAYFPTILDAISQKCLNMFKTLPQPAIPFDFKNRDRQNRRGSHTTWFRYNVGVGGGGGGNRSVSQAKNCAVWDLPYTRLPSARPNRFIWFVIISSWHVLDSTPEPNIPSQYHTVSQLHLACSEHSVSPVSGYATIH